MTPEGSRMFDAVLGWYGQSPSRLLWKYHQSTAKRIRWRFCNDKDELDQLARIGIWEAAKRYEAGRSLNEFVRFAAHHACNEAKRTLRSAGAPLPQDDDPWDKAGPDTHGLHGVVRQDESEHVRQAVDLLSENQQEVIKTVFGLPGAPCRSLTELADKRQVSQQALSKRYRLGLKKLKTYLGRKDGSTEKLRNGRPEQETERRAIGTMLVE